MKKTLAILLSVLMISGLLCITASAAPEGTAIKSAADFAAMAEDGKYYLDADIQIDATYDKIFTGTLDGNGHKVTVSVPMFNEFNGTVRNLTTAGKLEGTASHLAPIAIQSINGCTVENCVNNADVTIVTEEKGVCAAGFIGITRSQDTDFINCVNNGNISCTETADAKAVWGRSGGFVGASNAGQFTNCVNNGKIYVKGSDSAVGGFIGKAGDQNGTYSYTMKYCVNNGAVEAVAFDNPSYKGPVGAGFFGAAFGGGDKGTVEFYGCVNNGSVKCVNYMGGFVGWEWGDGDKGNVTLKYCVSAGDLIIPEWNNADTTPKTTWASAFVSYVNTPASVIQYCLVTGKIVPEGNAVVQGKGVTGNGNAMPGTIDTLLILDSAGYENVATSNKTEGVLTVADAVTAGKATLVTAAQVKSGEAARIINKASKLADGYKFDETANAATQKVIDANSAPVVPPTGDNAVILFIVAAAAVLGTAAVIKKKAVQ